MRRFSQVLTLLALLVAGIWLLSRPSQPAPETGARQDVLRRALGPAGTSSRQADTPSAVEEFAPEPAEPRLVDFSAIPERTGADLTSQYELWLRGEIDLDREVSRISEAEMATRREASLARAPDSDIQLASNVAPLLPPRLLRHFPSISFSDTAFIPPDPEIAAGPDHLLIAVNVFVAIYNKNGTELYSQSPYHLFAQEECSDGFLFDPNVLYDEKADRWIIAYAVGPLTDTGGYCLLASKSGDPTGAWYSYFFRTNSSSGWLDFPQAGVGDNHIFMAGNRFTSTPFFDQAFLYAFPKDQLYAGQTVSWSSRGLAGYNGSFNYFAPQPLTLHGAAQGTWPTLGNIHYFFIDDVRWTGSEYQLFYLLVRWNPLTNGLTTVKSFDFGTSGAHLYVPQLDGAPIDSNDVRPLDFEYRNGYGWLAITVGCNPGTGAVNCIRWAQIDLASGEFGPARTGLYASSGVHRFFPDLAVNHCGDMVIGYSKSSDSSWPSVWFTGRREGDRAGYLRSEQLLRAGDKPYVSFDTTNPARRWGDYTGMTPDPDGLTFWYVGEYSTSASTRANWGTYVGSFTVSRDMRCLEPTIAWQYLPVIRR